MHDRSSLHLRPQLRDVAPDGRLRPPHSLSGAVQSVVCTNHPAIPMCRLWFHASTPAAQRTGTRMRACAPRFVSRATPLSNEIPRRLCKRLATQPMPSVTFTALYREHAHAPERHVPLRAFVHSARAPIVRTTEGVRARCPASADRHNCAARRSARVCVCARSLANTHTHTKGRSRMTAARTRTRTFPDRAAMRVAWGNSRARRRRGRPRAHRE